jgi:hypothetical protein
MFIGEGILYGMPIFVNVLDGSVVVCVELWVNSYDN